MVLAPGGTKPIVTGRLSYFVRHSPVLGLGELAEYHARLFENPHDGEHIVLVHCVHAVLELHGHCPRVGVRFDSRPEQRLYCGRYACSAFIEPCLPSPADRPKSLLHFIGEGKWWERVLAKVRELVLPGMERHGPSKQLARHHQTQAIIAKRLGPVRMPDHAREPLHIGRKPRFTIV